MTESLFQQWQPAILQHMQDPSTATPLKHAAVNSQLADWTTCLTTAVVRSCEILGWQAAGKGHPLALLPQAGQEYLGIDVMAFAESPSIRGPFPLAAFELVLDTEYQPRPLREKLSVGYLGVHRNPAEL